MKVPRTSFKVPDYYGDNNWHVVNKDTDLSLSNPLEFKISGETFTMPSLWGNVSKLQSNWMWRYGFTSLYNSSTTSIVDEYGSTHTTYYFYYYEYYGTSTGSNTVPVTQLNVDINYSDRWYGVGQGYRITAAYQLNNSLSKSSLSGDYMIRFAGTGDWYVRSRPGYPEAANRSIIVKFTNDYIADLPSDMYSISGNLITWNTAHPIYRLMNGFNVFAVQS